MSRRLQKTAPLIDFFLKETGTAEPIKETAQDMETIEYF